MRVETSGDTAIERYGRWVLRNRWWVLGAALVVGVLAATGIPGLGLATDYRTFFSEDNPDLAAYEKIENVYTKNDNVLFVVRPHHGDVFSPEVLEMVRALTEDAWQIPHSTRVDSVTNFQHTWTASADADELIVEDLVGDVALTPEVVARARTVSLAEPLLAGRLIAADARTTGINVRIALPGETHGELPATVTHVRELLSEYRARYPKIDLHASGIAMMNWAFAEAPMRDMPFVMPLMFSAFVFAIVLFLRSFSGTAGTLAVVMLSTLTALGVAGALGVLLDPTSASAPTIILTLAVADSIHILVTWLQSRRDGASRHDAVIEALRINARPVFLTSVTTAIGFLTLNFSDSPPFRLLGNITAFGVIVAWAYSMTLLPALIAILPARTRRRSRKGRLDDLVERFANILIRRYRPVLATLFVGATALSLSIARLEVNDNYVEYFDSSLEVRRAFDFTVDHLTGVYTVTYSLDSGASQGVSDPSFLARVDAFADYLESRPTVAHVNSFTRTMKRLNRNLHGDDPAWHRLPDDQELAAQYLLLYELSLPYGLDVSDQIDVDKRSLRLDVTFEGTDDIVSIVERENELARGWLAAHGTESMAAAEMTGVPVMFSKITRRNIGSMVLGTGLGFVLIALILIAALRSTRLGLISLVPNVLPAAMAFGVWAWLVGHVGFAVSIVAGLAIGIIVDDTVHFLTKYQQARKERGLVAPEAVRYAFRTVGPAIVGTTFIVAAGFAMLGLSTFRVTSYMGLLTSLTVACALAIDFLLLPALLLAFDGDPARGRITDTSKPLTEAAAHS